MRLVDVYDDRDAVWQLVRSAGPYPLMMSLGGYEGFNGAMTPWFRAHWALDGEELIAGVRPLLDHRKFVEASQAIFDAPLVRPVALTINLMAPMKTGEGAHVDTPIFRGLNRTEFPTWLLVVMGSSHLFDRWYVPTSGALTWFYDGPNGAYDYWPDGPDGEMRSEAPPFGNVAVVADNDHMYHRAASVGSLHDYVADDMLPKAAQLIPGGNEGWIIRDGDGQALHHYSAGKVRVSLLWKAIVFNDENDAAGYDGHRDDLSVDHVIDTLNADLKKRGISSETGPDPFSDPAWQQALRTTYGLGSRSQ
jgi:hypothetical protein